MHALRKASSLQLVFTTGNMLQIIGQKLSKAYDESVSTEPTLTHRPVPSAPMARVLVLLLQSYTPKILAAVEEVTSYLFI